MNIKLVVLINKQVKKLKCRLLQFLFGALRVNTGLGSIIFTSQGY